MSSFTYECLINEITALREELAKCREEGRRQWDVAHGRMCGYGLAPSLKCAGERQCQWPMPKILEGE